MLAICIGNVCFLVEVFCGFEALFNLDLDAEFLVGDAVDGLIECVVFVDFLGSVRRVWD